MSIVRQHPGPDETSSTPVSSQPQSVYWASGWTGRCPGSTPTPSPKKDVFVLRQSQVSPTTTILMFRLQASSLRPQLEKCVDECAAYVLEFVPMCVSDESVSAQDAGTALATISLFTKLEKLQRGIHHRCSGKLMQSLAPRAFRLRVRQLFPQSTKIPNYCIANCDL